MVASEIEKKELVLEKIEYISYEDAILTHNLLLAFTKKGVRVYTCDSKSIGNQAISIDIEFIKIIDILFDDNPVKMGFSRLASIWS